ncbi:hypothetical protein EDC14_1004157 [Hydrogenispora ethanolica]|uniref:Uncharacterized protein n=1 Tax=Hydrogenispora ethanolica TaxID=1082276 RepID=A0A4R1S519_HYDET|nr:hypothetical protein [Hydrogenispora ethanolica]TCL74219.1 hypothetical protein EDC14_1004157 [Hydrogenispora ethanolica]
MTDKQQDYYECKCIACGHVFHTAKSILQSDFEMNDAGSGTCPNCKAFLNLTFIPEENQMKSSLWDDYLKTKKKAI